MQKTKIAGGIAIIFCGVISVIYTCTVYIRWIRQKDDWKQECGQATLYAKFLYISLMTVLLAMGCVLVYIGYRLLRSEWIV